VTTLSPERMDARAIYEDFYCARGDMENRIKEQQLDMFADRTAPQRCVPTNCGYICPRPLIS